MGLRNFIEKQATVLGVVSWTKNETDEKTDDRFVIGEMQVRALFELPILGCAND